jgi:heat shock protein HtpX
MNTTKIVFLMATLTVLLVAVGNVLGGQSGMIMTFMVAVVMNFGTYWFSDKILLKMYGARELKPEDSPDIFKVTENLVAAANIPMPRLYLVKEDQPNAFATGRNPSHAAVAVTEGIMRLLSREELRAVIAHELAHVKHRDTLIGAVAATFAGAISMLANMAQWAMIFGGGRSSEGRGGGHPLAAIAMIIVAPIAAMMIQMAISRSREFLADEGGAQMAGNPLPLANALRKLHQKSALIPINASPATAHLFIVNPLHGGGLTRLFSTHPPVEERVSRLKAMVYGQNIG